MNKSIKWLAILSVLLLALLSFSLVACENGDNGDDTQTDTATSTDTSTNTDTDTSTETDTGTDTSTNTDTDTDTDTSIPVPEEPEIYNVTFRQGNGVPDVVLQIERGTNPTLPEIKPQEGYILEWEVTDFTNLCNDSLVTLHKTPIPYEIVYVLGEGVNNEDNPESITIGKKVALLAPSRPGCNFAGWYADEEMTQSITEITGISSSITVYAKWEPIEYNIYYMLNAGTNNPQNPTKYNVDSEITLLSPTKTDFDFVGWYIKDTDTKVETTEDILGDVELEARWIVERFEITYVGTTDDEHENPADFDKTENITLKPATRYGYTFGGWFLDKNLTVPVDKILGSSQEDKTIYAKFTIDKFTIQYVTTPGMAGAVNNITEYDVNTEYEFVNPAVSDGYIFEGWYIQGTDTKVEAIVPGGALRQNLVLEPKIGYKKYEINYNLNDGILPDDAKDYYTLENVGSNKYVLPTPTKQGYIFMGWYGDAKFQTAEVTSLNGNDKKDVTLYACWMVAKYNITYNYGIAGTGVTNNNPKTFDMNTVVTFEKPSKEGFIFIGWYSDSSCETVIKSTEGLYEHITVYAKWIEGSNIADQANLTTTATCWICNQSTLGSIVDGNRETAIGGNYLSADGGKYTLTFAYDNNQYVKNVVIVCNGKGTVVPTGDKVTEVTNNAFNIMLVAYDAEGNVVYDPSTKSTAGKETLEFEIDAEIARIEIVVNTAYVGSYYLWEVEINAAA